MQNAILCAIMVLQSRIREERTETIHMEYGIQMFSVRDVAEKDLREALRKVAELGYRYVEFAGFFGHPAEEVKGWLDGFGLVCSGTHTGVDQLVPGKIDATIAYHKAIGCDNLIVPAAHWKPADVMEANIALLNEAQKKLAENGIALGYHNHSKEFLENPCGKVMENELLERTDVELEVDTFWAFNAGIDPVDFLEAHKDRIRVIHLKDGIPTAPENRNYEHVHDGVQGKALGEGKAPVTRVRDWAIRNGVRIVVESEGLDPTGPEEVARCIRYLRSLEG